MILSFFKLLKSIKINDVYVYVVAIISSLFISFSNSPLSSNFYFTLPTTPKESVMRMYRNFVLMNESRWNWIPIDDVKLLSLVVLFAKKFPVDDKLSVRWNEL